MYCLRLFSLGSILLFTCWLYPRVAGHGYLLQPLGRDSAWRKNGAKYFYINYDDNANYCGGFGIQHSQNKGKCGFCGDNWSDPTPRRHERGGFYSTGNIVSEYASGDVIDVVVVITVNHMGTFVFDVCTTDDSKDPETETCFHDLQVVNQESGGLEDSFRLPHHKPDTFLIKVKLPETITCRACVLRWRYVTGNSWGCARGVRQFRSFCCTGCGDVQENFYSCSDIMITESGREGIPAWTKVGQAQPDITTATTTTTTTTTKRTTTTTRKPTTTMRRPTTKRPRTRRPTTRRPTTRRPTTQRPTTTTPKPTTTESYICNSWCKQMCTPKLRKNFCFAKNCGMCPQFNNGFVQG